MRTKPLTQKEILADILVTTRYTLRVLGGFAISGIVSVFGLYPLVESFFKSEIALYITIVGFIGLLILIDSVKRNTLSRYYNSRLKNIIQGSKIRHGYLNISIMSILFVVIIDGSGAWLTAVSGQKQYTENQAKKTENFKNIETGKENDSLTADAYKSDLTAYEKREADYRALCETNLASGKWKDSVTKNMNSWYKKNPRPKAPKLLSSEDLNKEFNAIKEGNKGFLDEYLQYIIFVVLILLTGLLQYLTISEIKEDHEDLEDSLTASRVTNIRTALATAQDIEEQHEKKTFEDKGEMQKKKYEQHRDMTQIDDKREIVFNAKSIQNGNEGLQLIASSNNETYVNHEPSKAGHVVNPFFKEEMSQAEKNKIRLDGGIVGDEDEILGMFNKAIERREINFNLDSMESRKELERYLESKISIMYPSLDFVRVGANSYEKNQSKIDVFFNDVPAGETITYFGEDSNDHDLPIHPKLKDRIPSVYEILYPFLKSEATTVNETLDDIGMIEGLYKPTTGNIGDKLASKTQLIDVHNRTEDRNYKKLMKILDKADIVEFKKGYGYYALKSKEDALNAIKKDK